MSSHNQYGEKERYAARKASRSLLEAVMVNTKARLSKDGGVVIEEGATETDIIDIIYRLYYSGKVVTTQHRFAIGDAWNAMPGAYGSRKKLIEKRFGQNAYNLFKEYGWIAHRWPPEEREDCKHGWTHYKEQKPGEEVRTRPLRVRDLQIIEETEREGGVEFFAKDDSGREYRLFRKDSRNTDKEAERTMAEEKEEVGVYVTEYSAEDMEGERWR